MNQTNNQKNRLIKFRVFDKHLNKYIPFHSINKVVFEDESYIFQQFTGLLDRNGREIYEGDILKNDHPHSPYEVKFGERHIVTSHSSDWDDITREKTIGYYLYRPFDDIEFDFFPTKMEIIGNIFESPNLLNKNS